MDKIKFGVLGMGYIGKRHATLVDKNEDTKLVALHDIRPKEACQLEDFDAPFYSDLTEFLQQDFDVLCVASPNGLHAEHALKGLEQGKHVLVEKPMALTKADCEKVIFKALEQSKQVFCVMQNRYSPPSIWLKEVLNQELLGKIYMVQVNCYWNRDDRYYSKSEWKGTKDLDGGTLFTQFSHFVDMMYWLFGDIKNIKTNFQDFAHEHNTHFEDSGFVSFDFVNGGMGSINYSTAVWEMNFESSLTVIGEKGTVKVGGQYMNEVEYCNIEGYDMPDLPEANPANDYGHYKGSAANHNYIFSNIVDTLQGKGSISTNALEGMKVVEIIERIYQSNPFFK